MKLTYIAIPLAFLSLAGCVENQGGQSYAQPSAQQTQVRSGTIVGSRNVELQTTNPNDQVAGTLMGAALGGVIGNQFGKGSGNTAATIIGAGAGAAVGGNMAAKNATKVTYRRAWEVRMRDGQHILVLKQGGRFRVGERVRVVGSGGDAHLEHY
jgi:outer membrane lipoprotein SlyB